MNTLSSGWEHVGSTTNHALLTSFTDLAKGNFSANILPFIYMNFSWPAHVASSLLVSICVFAELA